MSLLTKKQKSMAFHLFHHSISFSKTDPLGDGLGDEIEAEKLEPEAITLEEGLNEGEIEAYWNSVERDIEKDPEWFRFSDN
jgi:hypothetical protein